MPSYRETGAMKPQMDDLRLLYNDDRTEVLREALDWLHARHFADQHPRPVRILGWTEVRLAADTPCGDDEHQHVIPAGELAVRELWSDDRPGAIVCLAAIEA